MSWIDRFRLRLQNNQNTVIHIRSNIERFENNHHYDEIIKHYFCDEETNREDIIKLLYDRNLVCNKQNWINNQDHDGYTALHIACIMNNEKIIKKLLANKANMYIKDHNFKFPHQYLCIPSPPYRINSACVNWRPIWPSTEFRLKKFHKIFNDHKPKVFYHYLYTKWINKQLLYNDTTNQQRHKRKRED